MKLIVEEEMETAQSRVTHVRFIDMQLRLWELWREAAGGHQEALVQMAVGAINGEGLTRGDFDPKLRSLANVMPPDLMTKCNLSSIAEATGINRETVRRIVNRLVMAGRLARPASGAIHFAPGFTQGAEAHRLGHDQLQEFCRIANLLLRDGVLSWESRGFEPTES